MTDRDWWVHAPVDIRGTRWLAAALVLAIVAILLRQPLLLTLAIVLALAAASARLWWRFGLSEVTYRRHLATTHASFGDEIEIELITENAKPLPLVWLEVTDEFPLALEVIGTALEPSSKMSVGMFKAFFSVRPYERVRRRYRLRCARRGYHHFGPVTLTTGDPFGFAARERELDQIDTLIVYPRVLSVEAFGLPARQPLGTAKPVQPLIEDPLLVTGVRPYLAGDSPRRIHWRASARTGSLQVKQFEPSAEPVVMLFLDTNTFEYFWQGQDVDLLELAITVTASLAAHELAGGHQVGLVANAPTSGSARFVRIPPGRHPAQLGRVLETLALLVAGTGVRIEQNLTTEAARLPWGATIVVITANVTAGLQRTLVRLARSGRRATLISCGPEPELAPELRRRLTVYHIAAEESWDVPDTIVLAG